MVIVAFIETAINVPSNIDGSENGYRVLLSILFNIFPVYPNHDPRCMLNHAVNTIKPSFPLEFILQLL